MPINKTPTIEPQATCTYCQGDYPEARAELGYNYCMKPDCREQGFKVTPIEITFTEADTSRF